MVFFSVLILLGAYVGAIVLPLASSGPLRDFALRRNTDLRDEFGWEDLVRIVAMIRDSLPPDQRSHLGVIVSNYGEAGAIELLGPRYQLPAPISMTNSAWLRAYPTPPPATLIVLGATTQDVNEALINCRLAGRNGNAEGIENEESRDHPVIFVCGPPRLPWPEFWRKYRSFG
jgi:hypothetical protein